MRFVSVIVHRSTGYLVSEVGSHAFTPTGGSQDLAFPALVSLYHDPAKSPFVPNHFYRPGTAGCPTCPGSCGIGCNSTRHAGPGYTAWERVLDGSKLALYGILTFHDYERETIHLPVTLTFQADFEDAFEIRSLLPKKTSQEHSPVRNKRTLVFDYDGADRRYRSLTVHFAPAPLKTQGTRAHFEITLRSRASQQLLISLIVAESPQRDAVQTPTHWLKSQAIESTLQQASDEWMANQTQVRSDSVLLKDILERSLRDLRVLQMSIKGQEFFAAGVPWFSTLFGRDSLITAVQTLAFNPSIAAETLRILARYQGQKVDNWRDEQLGEILPDERNQVTLHPTEKDQWGIPVPYVHFNLFENDRQMMHAGIEKARAVLHAAGATATHFVPRYAHLVGTCRMGFSPEDSVVDQWGRSWDVPNLLICDGSILPTQGSANPALTISALAARTADCLCDAARRGELNARPVVPSAFS